MKAILSIIALGTVSLLSADQYGYGSCPGGNCPNPYYNSQGGNQGQNYRDQNQGYRDQQQYQGQSRDYRDYQGYRQQSQPQGGSYNPQQDRNYSRNDQRNQSNAQYSRQNSQANDDNRQGYNGDNRGYNNPHRDNDQNNDNRDNRYVTERYNVNEDNVRESEKNYPQDTAATEADRQLNAKIREKISDGWFVRSYEIVTLRSNNGVVTLVGFVDSNDDIKKINDKLKEVDGIRSVNNQINVKNK